MNQKEIEYILSIASEQSITKAADKLGMSQPALSIFLSRLEDTLGTKLFIRGSSGIHLTYQGECYIKMAKKSQKLYRDFQAQLCDMDNNHIGNLKIGTSAHIGSYVLPNVFPYYKRCFPNMELSIYEGTSEKLEELLNNCEVDAALMHLPLKNINANYEFIADDKYVVAFAKGDPLEEFMYHKTGERFPYIHPEVLCNEKFILAFPYQRVRQITNSILSKAKIFYPDILLTTSSVQTALRFAESGMGVTFLPESYIKLFYCPKKPNFCYMEKEYNAYWSFVIAYPKGSELSAPLKAFIQITKDTYC